MEVILNSDVKGLGKKGDVVKVSDGYGRNYLLPRELAREATAASVQRVQQEKARAEEKLAKELSDAQAKARSLESQTLEYVAKAGDKGRLFGAITSKDLADSINRKFGLNVDKKKIDIGETIKTLGAYDVKIKLYPNVSATIKVIVKQEE